MDKKYQILIVEDNSTYYKSLIGVIEQIPGIKFSVDNAKSPESTKKILSQNFYHLVLLSLGEPASISEEIYDVVIKEFKSGPIIILIENMDIEQGIEYVDKGAHDFLIKGKFDYMALAKSIHLSKRLFEYQKTNRENEILLKETHHRAKNNLQTLSSLLSLQIMNSNNSESKKLLLDCKNRISTMAIIHETLNNSTNFRFVNAQNYFELLVGNLFQTFYSLSENIKIKKKISSMDIAIDISIPMGLIINEVVSNSIKHAFGNVEHPSVSINLKKVNTSKLLLEIADNGKGFPKDFNYDESNTLGLRLIKLLAENQLDGKLAISNSDRGVKYSIVSSYRGR